jgi:TonB family protein
MRPGWLIGVPFSLALHVVLAAAFVAVLRSGHGPPALIVDLTAIVAGREDGPAASAGAPAPSFAMKSRGARRIARSESSRAPTAPLRDRGAVEPAPSAPASMELSPVRRQESPAAEASSAVASAPTVMPGAESNAARASTQGVVVDGTTSGGSAPAATGPGGAVGDRVASLGVAGGGGGGGDYAVYLSRLRKRIQETLRYPPAARRRGVTGTVQLEIAIEPDGAVGSVSVIGTSAHEILDRAAVDAARSVPRLPFPDDMRPRGLRVRLPVIFELE